MSVSQQPSRLPAGRPARRQRGVVLLVALIVLVAMTLAGVALIRSVDTANVIAGNLAFHQSATSAGERSTEIVLVNWLGPGSLPGSTVLHNDDGTGYFAARADPASWDDFWRDNPKRLALPAGARCPSNAQADLACNRVEYVMHRLCANAGPPNTATNRCTQPPPSASSGESTGAGRIGPPRRKQVYYRITTRIQGPRNTVSYIQTIVAL
jgi:type IV pilus assembly protein PilX